MLKQVCILKQCPFKRYAPPATVTPEAKRVVVKTEVETDEESSDEHSNRATSVQSNNGKRKCETSIEAAEQSTKRPHSLSLKAAEVAGPSQAATAAVGNIAGVTSNVARAKVEQVAATTINNATNTPVAQATLPASFADGNVPNDLVLCQMELKRALAENKRQADEITRLKSALQAVTASLTG